MSPDPPATIRMQAGPWLESANFESELDARGEALTDHERALARSLHDDGFAVVRDAVATELCDRVQAEVEPYFLEEYALQEKRVPNAWQREATSVREVATLPSMQRLLAALYGRRPIPFQTLNFKWGSQQGYHADAAHFTSVPDRFMCGVWVALEDVHHDNGPLTYYPGSHRVPQFRSFEPGASPDRYASFEATQSDVMHRLGVEPVDLHANKGDALIWTSHLLHGGRPILRPGSTRWSQVTHYFFEDCIYFQPIYSDFMTGSIKLLDITDINTLEPVPHRYGDLEVVTTRLPDGRSRLGLLDATGREVDGDVAAFQRLEGEVVQLRAEGDELRRSTSYRIGNSVVAPLHRLRQRLR